MATSRPRARIRRHSVFIPAGRAITDVHFAVTGLGTGTLRQRVRISEAALVKGAPVDEGDLRAVGLLEELPDNGAAD